MSGPAAATWSCPACERHVPSREDVCHCGYDRRRTPVRRQEPAGQESAGAGLGRLLTALAAVVVGAVVFVAINTMKGGRPGSPQPGVGGGPSPASEAPTAEVSPATEEGAPVVQTTPPPAPATVAAPSASAKAPTGVELARRQASELLEPLIRPIAKEADALDFKFRYYLETCRPDFTGAPQVAAGRYWFVVWASRKEIEWSDDRTEPSVPGKADAPDCRGTWIDLLERAGNVASALQRLEEAARAKEVPPGQVDELLAAHRLTGWRESRPPDIHPPSDVRFLRVPHPADAVSEAEPRTGEDRFGGVEVAADGCDDAAAVR